MPRRLLALLLLLPLTVFAFDVAEPLEAGPEGPALGEVVEPGSFNPYAQLQEDVPVSEVAQSPDSPARVLTQTYAMVGDGAASSASVRLCRTFCENGIWPAK